MLQSLLSFVVLLPRRLRVEVTLPLAAASVLVSAFFCLYGLGGFALRDNNEGLYASIARAMLADGDWLIPHLNGVPYIEKPPLLYWLEAVAMAAFGPTPSAARLAAALPMLALCLGVNTFCRRHAGARAGWLAGAILSSMVPVALGAHLVLFDPLLCALLGGALLCWLHGVLASSSAAGRTAACLLALAVLDKGAVALVLAVGSAGLLVALVRHARPGLRWRPPRGALLLFVALVLPWHVLAALRQPGFTWFYIVNEHVLRFLGRRLPDDYHHGPPWFYLGRVLLMVAPWTPFLALPVRGANGATRGLLLRFCAAGVVFPLLFFSASQAKADYYLIVCAPFLAVWLALVLDAALDEPSRAAGARLAWCWAAAVALCVVLLVALPGADGRAWSPLLLALPLLGWLCLLAPCARAWRALARAPAPAREAAVLGIALLAAPLLAWAVGRAAAHEADDSSRGIAAVLRELPGPARTVFLYRDFEDRFSTLPFYLGRNIPIIDSASHDLAFGCAVAPQGRCIDHQAFLRRARAGPVAVAVHAARRDEFLAMAGPGWRSIAIGPRIVFLSVP